MPKMIISIDGVVVKEVQLTKDRTTLGRRPYNDVVIENLAVSGEHAVLQMSGSDVQIEDLNSTNGTYVNGQAAKKQLLHHNDTIEVGKYKIKFIHELGDTSLDKTQIAQRPAVNTAAAPSEGGAAIKVLNGAAAGRQMALVKAVTTVGKPGVAVASITRRSQGYAVTVVENARPPLVNGKRLGSEPQMLRHGDVLELAGTQMQFVMH